MTTRLARTLVAASLAPACAVGLGVTGAGRAGAAAAISISSPSGGQAYQSQPAIRGSATPDTAEHLSRNIQLEVKDTDQAGLVDLTTVVSGTAGASAAAPFGWQPTLSYNGHYLAIVTVWQANPAGLEDGPYNATQSFVMQVPPARPAPPNAALGADRASASVSWRPNGEPDLLGYQLLRTPSYTGGKVPTIAKGDTLCSPSACSYTDSDVAPGTAYQYQVEAVRSAGPGTTSGVTATSDLSPKLAVPAPAAASTTLGTVGATGAAAPQGAASSQPAPLAPALARTGKVDLSGFAALLDHSRAAALRPPPEPDNGFQTALPYSPAQPEPGQGGNPVARRAAVLGAGDGPARVRPWAFFALGLLVTAVALHLLWLRGEVGQGPDLEALPVPAPTPPARAGRRVVPVPASVPAPPPSPTSAVAAAAAARPRELRRLAG